MATFQERINQLYEEAKDTNYKLTQTEYAAQFGATRNQLKGWLDGRGEPNSEMLKLIAKLHGVSVSWLVGESDVRNFTEPTSAHRIAINIDHLPPEAIQSIEEYIELLQIKYRQRSSKK